MIEQLPQEDFKNGKINLHIHSCFSDGKARPEDIVKEAKEKGYKKISISDHNTVEAYIKTNILEDNIVIPAVEFDCWYKMSFYHLLAYEIDPKSEYLKPFLAQNPIASKKDFVRIFSFNRSPEKLIPAIHKAGGKAILAHPACSITFNFNKLVKELIDLGLDGLEVYYPYSIRLSKIIRCTTQKHIEEIANKYNLIKTGGTDFHGLNL